MEKKASFQELVEIIAKLRDPQHGCPWDLKQTHSSLKEYLLEEAYELLEALEDHLDESKAELVCEELGDVLLQVLLHAQIASEQNKFDIDDVNKKLAA